MAARSQHLFGALLGPNAAGTPYSPYPAGTDPTQPYTSEQSGETRTLIEWADGYELTSNPDGTVEARTKFSSGIPPMTLRPIVGPPKQFRAPGSTKIFHATGDAFIVNIGDETGAGCSSGITGNLCGDSQAKCGWSFDEFLLCKNSKVVNTSDKSYSSYQDFKTAYTTAHTRECGTAPPATSSLGCNPSVTGCKCGAPNIENCDAAVTTMRFSDCNCVTGAAKVGSSCKMKACLDIEAANYANPQYPDPNPIGTTGWTDCNTNLQGRCYISDPSMCVYTCNDPNRETTSTGACGSTCKSGYQFNSDGTLCVEIATATDPAGTPVVIQTQTQNVQTVQEPTTNWVPIGIGAVVVVGLLGFMVTR